MTSKKTFEEFLQENFQDDIVEYNINVKVQEVNNKKRMIVTNIVPVDSPFNEKPVPLAVSGNNVICQFDVDGDEVRDVDNVD